MIRVSSSFFNELLKATGVDAMFRAIARPRDRPAYRRRVDVACTSTVFEFGCGVLGRWCHGPVV